MKINLQIEDAPEGFDAHTLARVLVDRAECAFQTLESVQFDGGNAVITGTARLPSESDGLGIF